MATMDDSLKKAFDFASDSTKQLITLSAGILTLTVTFAKNFFQTVATATKTPGVSPVTDITSTVTITDIPAHLKTILIFAWALYLASILFGLLTLFAYTGELERKPSTNGSTPANPSIRVRSASTLSVLQQLAFLFATGLIIYFGASAL